MTFLCTVFVILVITPDPQQFLSERDLQYLYKICSTVDLDFIAIIVYVNTAGFLL